MEGKLETVKPNWEAKATCGNKSTKSSNPLNNGAYLGSVEDLVTTDAG